MSVFTVVTATASTFFNGATTAAMAFDGDDTTIWHSTSDMPCWIQGQMASAVVVNFCSIQIYTVSAARSPRDFTIQGSNDGSAWTTLDTRTSIIWALDEFKTFTFTNTTAYSYYRVSITANNGDNYENMRRIDFGDISVAATTRMVETYVETLTVPTSSPRNLVESYVEILTVPTSAPRRLIEASVEVLTSVPLQDLTPDTRISALSGTVLWLRAKDNGNNGSSISSWVDQSGKIHNGSAAGTAPTVATWSTPLGGKSVRFGGAGMFRCSVLGGATATSSTNYASEPPANAIDGNPGTHFTTNGIKTGWLRLQLPTARVVTSYSIRRRDDLPTRNIKDWTFEGSSDGAAWTTLETRTGVTWPTAGQTQTFTFSNSTAYLYYRVNFTDNNGDASYTSITEIAFDHYMLGVAAAEIWAVIKSDGSVGGPWSFNDRSDARAFLYYPFNASNGIYESFGVKNDSGGIIATYAGNTAWHIYRVVMDGTNVTSYIDGASIGTHTVASAGGVQWGLAPLIGQTAANNAFDAFFHGNMAEVLVRTQVSTALETGDITNYLRAEHFAAPSPFQGWGIPL